MRPLPCSLVFALLLLPAGALGQTTDAMDAEARALFEAGNTAFNDTRYADALTHFRRAYELSERPELLYNVGVAADRLRRDAEALDAFEAFLAAVPDHPRRRDVEARVRILRESVARAEAAPEESAGDEEPDLTESPPPAPAASGGPSTLAIAGASTLGALGVAGVVAAIAGMAGGECLAHAGGTCIEERRPAWAPIGVYGGLGIAAIAGAIVWIVVDAGQSGGEGEVQVGLGPSGLSVRGSF